MLKQLLVTTALVTLMSTAALAESSNTTSTQGSTGTNATMSQGSSGSQSGQLTRYLSSTEARGRLASKLIGMNIYSGQGDNSQGSTSGSLNTSTTQGSSGGSGTSTTQGTSSADATQGSSGSTGGTSTTQGTSSADATQGSSGSTGGTSTTQGTSSADATQGSSGSTGGSSSTTTQGSSSQADASQGSSGNSGGSSGSTSSMQSSQANASQTGESIGEINDLIIGDDGRVKAVIVGVGGFLGMGEKNVAVAYEDLKWTNTGGNQTPTAYVMASKETLKSAPSFDTNAADMANAGNGNSTSTSSTTAANTTSDTTNSSSTGTTSTGTSANNSSSGGDQQNLTPAKDSMLSADNLTNRTVYSADNQNIGEVGDVLLKKDGTIAAVVLDVGGFLGIGEKPVAIAFNDLKVMADQSNNLYLYTKFTKNQLESAPTFNKDTYSSNPDSMILRSGS